MLKASSPGHITARSGAATQPACAASTGVQNGGSARGCHQRVDHALRSEPPADPRARERPRRHGSPL